MTMCWTPRMSVTARVMVSVDPGKRVEKVLRVVIPSLAAVLKNVAAGARTVLDTRIRRKPVECGTERATRSNGIGSGSMNRTSRLGLRRTERGRAADMVKMLCGRHAMLPLVMLMKPVILGDTVMEDGAGLESEEP